MLDCDNPPHIQCQDHETVDAQEYHSAHRKGLDLLKKKLSSCYFQMLVYRQSHISDDAYKGFQRPEDRCHKINIVSNLFNHQAKK